jgi:ribonucleoside-diphosphate reductase alpha chain
MEKVASEGVVRKFEEIPEDVRKIFGTAHEIDLDWHVKVQSVFQKHTENAVSKTINLDHDATVDDVKRAYLTAWESDCKGITIFRDGSKSAQVLNIGTKDKPLSDGVPEAAVLERPMKVEGATYRIPTPLGVAFITVNQDQNGSPFETFVTIGKAGSEVAAMAEALGRLISTNFRFGNHLPARERAREIVEQLRGIGGGRSVGFGPNKVRSLPDAVAKAISLHFGFNGVNHLEEQASLEAGSATGLPTEQAGADMAAYSAPPQGVAQLSDPTPAPAGLSKIGDICPSCGASALVYEEGCAKCHACGHSEC